MRIAMNLGGDALGSPTSPLDSSAKASRRSARSPSSGRRGRWTSSSGDIGVTELWPAVFPVGDDAETSMRRTRALLAKLAPEQ